MIPQNIKTNERNPKMKAQQIMDLLFDLGECGRLEKTCDTIKSGSPDAEVTKIAVSMFATPEVVRKAKETGAQLLVVHEPTYFNHWDEHSDEPFEVEKRRLIEESGITIYRYHDYPHRAPKDMICEGEIKYMKLDGEVEFIGRFDKVRIRLNTPMTPRELAAHIEKNVGIKHIRIAGAADSPCTKITGMFGTPGGIEQELRSDDCEVVMTGEVCEWALAEWVRQAAQMGHKKALLVLGHLGSERDGMRLVADILKEKLPEIPTEYIESGEVYTYTD